MFYEIDELTNHFICDAPHADSVSPTIVDSPPLNPDGTGMRKARWTGTWDKQNKQWADGGWIDEEAVQLASDLAAEQLIRDNAIVLKALQENDISSVRAIREWLSQQPGCPQILQDHETYAQNERAKLK